MIELTEHQRQELENPEPRALDPTTRAEYVLVRAEVFERLKGLLVEDDAEAMYPLLAELDSEDWEDASVYGISPPP